MNYHRDVTTVSARQMDARNPLHLFRGESARVELGPDGSWLILSSDGEGGHILYVVTAGGDLALADGDA